MLFLLAFICLLFPAGGDWMFLEWVVDVQLSPVCWVTYLGSNLTVDLTDIISNVLVKIN